MACFDNIISLEELCADITPTSTFYLNQIGINKSEIEQMLTKDYSSVQDFITKKSNFAVSKVTSDIYNFLSPNFKANSILAGARVGYPDPNKVLVTQSGYVGVKVELYNPESFVNFITSDISLFTDYTGTIPVLIYDLDQGLLLQTINVGTIAGQITTSYEKAVLSAPRRPLNIWMGYDSSIGINSYQTTAHNGCAGCRGYKFNHRYIQAGGAAIESPFTEGSITSLTHTAGISFNYSVECNHKDWLCNHRNFLGLPILYKTGIEICNHAILAAPNQRSMTNTTVNVDLMEKKLTMLTSEYDAIMRSILNNMSVPNDRNCFYCEQRITSRTTLA